MSSYFGGKMENIIGEFLCVICTLTFFLKLHVNLYKIFLCFML